MTRLRIHSLVVSSFVAVALFAAPSALAADTTTPPDVSLATGWDTDWALLFSLQNIFVQTDILQGYGGGVALQKNLDPTTAIRGSVGITRTTDPAYVQTTTTTFGGNTNTTQTLVTPAGPTSTFGLTINADYLKRLSTTPFAAYVGGGISIALDSEQRGYTDNVTVPNQTTVENDATNVFGLGLRGVLGVDWRVNKSISLFAEYALGVTPFSQTSVTTSTTVTDSTGNQSSQTSKGAQSHVFDFTTGLSQGGSLGVIAFF